MLIKYKLQTLIPSFHLGDNSVHLHECSPFWVGIFIILKKKTIMFTVSCRHAHYDWQSTQVYLFVNEKANVMLTWTYIIVLYILGKHNFKPFYYMYIHIIEIPTNKGANSYKP